MATAIPKAYLASSAIRCRDVETGPNLGVLAVFPSTGATCRCPLPSTGSRGLNSPRFGGTMRHSDSSPSIPPRFRCLRPAVPSEHLRLRSVGRQVLRPRPRAW